jgi:hypothetical protein
MRFFSFIIALCTYTWGTTHSDTLIAEDTTWDSDTVICLKTISVDSNATLVIRPGTTVLFGKSCQLKVIGALVAEGNPQDSIRFLPVDTSGWWGIVFKNTQISADSSKMKHCVLQNVNNNMYRYGAIFVTYYPWLELTNSRIQNCSSGGVSFYRSNGRVRDCIIGSNKSSKSCLGCVGGINLLVASVEIIGNQLIDNQSTYGGGIFIDESTAFVKGNTIQGNSSSYGGGAYVSYCTQQVLFEGNSICNNSCSGNGGGLSVSDNSTQVSLINNRFTNNNGENGGGICIDGSKVVLKNNLIANNLAWISGNGNGICVINAAVVSGINLTIVNNGVKSAFAQASTKIDLVNTIIWSVEGTATEAPTCKYSFCYVGNQTNVINAVPIDPLFVSPTKNSDYKLDANAADWNLLDRSPCVNAGTPDTSGLGIPLTDLNGKTRVFARIDIGSCENQVSTPVLRERNVDALRSGHFRNTEANGERMIDLRGRRLPAGRCAQTARASGIYMQQRKRIINPHQDAP